MRDRSRDALRELFIALFELFLLIFKTLKFGEKAFSPSFCSGNGAYNKHDRVQRQHPHADVECSLMGQTVNEPVPLYRVAFPSYAPEELLRFR